MVTLLYDVHHQVTFGWLISIYFYFTGLSAGSFIISTMSYGFGIKLFKPIAKTAVVMATLLLCLAPIGLILQVGWPIRSIWNHFVYLNPSSPMTYGAILLVAYPVNCIFYMMYMFREDLKKTKLFGMIGIPLAISVHGYTGFILAFGKARAYWNTALMPTLFLVSAIVSGIALMILIALIKQRYLTQEKKVDWAIINGLAQLFGWAVMVDLFLTFCDLAVLSISHGTAQEMTWLMLGGQFAPLFIGVENVFGKIIPMLICLIPALRRPWLIVLACLFNVIGILAMRYVTVFGGQYLPLM